MASFESATFGTIDPIPLIAGVLFLVAGWLLYWVSLTIAGGVLGGGLGLLASDVARSALGLEEPWGLILRVCAVLIGIAIGVAIVRFLAKTAFFLTGFVLGALCWFVILRALRDGGVEWAQNDLIFALGVPITGLVLGALAVILNKHVIALASAILGAILIMIGISWHWGFWPVAPLALLGYIFQITMTRKKRMSAED